MQWDFSSVWSNIGILSHALLVTFAVSAASIALGTVLGTCLAIGALSSIAVIRFFAHGTIEFLLAMPALVLIVWIYYCLPLLASHIVLSGFNAAVLGLGLSLSGFVAQITRAGINTVPQGQLESAYCLGVSRWEAMRFILLPQAFRRMLPPLMGQYITCYKFSTLASIVAVGELLHTGSTIIAQTYRPLEVYTAIAAIFLVTVIPLNHLAAKLERFSHFGGVQGL